MLYIKVFFCILIFDHEIISTPWYGRSNKKQPKLTDHQHAAFLQHQFPYNCPQDKEQDNHGNHSSGWSFFLHHGVAGWCRVTHLRHPPHSQSVILLQYKNTCKGWATCVLCGRSYSPFQTSPDAIQVKLPSAKAPSTMPHQTLRGQTQYGSESEYFFNYMQHTDKLFQNEDRMV